MVFVASLSFEKRLELAFQKTLPKLAPEIRAQLQALITPATLAIIAGVLVAWIVSHAFGLGEIIDIILMAAGIVSIGFVVFTGVDHLYDFAVGTYRAKTEQDVDKAADHLAKAIGILGIQVVIAVLFRGAKISRTTGTRNLEAGPRNGGIRYKPKIHKDPFDEAGAGVTSMWGDITVSTQGNATDRALVLLHERVHQFLTPKLYFLREYRVGNSGASYSQSSLWRYLEEALAETIAQVGVNGIRQFFTGIRYPVKNGYVYLMRGGGYRPKFTGNGVLPEAAGLLYNGVVLGMAFEVRFQPINTPN